MISAKGTLNRLKSRQAREIYLKMDGGRILNMYMNWISLRARQVYYIGNVMSCSTDNSNAQWQIQFIRRRGPSILEFFYPEKLDISMYPLDAIVRFLSIPKILRGPHIFQMIYWNLRQAFDNSECFMFYIMILSM